MRVVTSISEMSCIKKSLDNDELSLGFVPTMGALHEGHLSLIKESLKVCDKTVVSIFVNPTQFNDQNDLEKYPRPLKNDQELLAQSGVDYLFLPTYEEMYKDDYRYKVCEVDFSKMLCGKDRPGHFDGVLTVVMKLFNIIKPNKAFFGQKDFQQLTLIKGMVSAFFMEIDIVGLPIKRDGNGLALSSRNSHLSETDQVFIAKVFSERLKGHLDTKEIKRLIQSDGVEVDYIEEHFGRRLGAVRYKNIRLIDNVETAGV